MMDELQRLKAAIKASEPAPDGDARAQALALARQEFDRLHQGKASARRPTGNPSHVAAALQKGLNAMWTRLNSRPALLATTSLATIALAFVIVQNSTPPALTPEIAATLTPDDSVTVPAQIDVRSKQAETAQSADALAEYDLAMDAPAPAAPRLEIAEEPMIRVAPGAEMQPSTMMQDQVVGLIAQAPVPETRVSNQPEPSGDQFAGADFNPLRITAEQPVSTFSIDVDTASYSYVRSTLLDGFRPQADAVRVEELINYFDYDYPVPDAAETPFRPSLSVFETPWNPDTRLIQIAIRGFEPDMAGRTPANLVFLIDTSGSMQDANKLPLLVRSFQLMLENLQPDDRIAIVTYAGSAGLVLEPTRVADSAGILAALQNLSAGGSTAGSEGLQQAYAVAAEMADNGNARVILATDGDFNVGISDPEELKSFIAKQRESGVDLSVLGFGRGNYDDATMQSLAQNGNGQAAYIDTLAEAQKVLVQDVAATLVPIANDVKIQVEWNPATVAEYRLIGYETRALNREDFNNDRIDAGEIGSGHTITALYEITPVGSDAVMTSPLRYGTEEAATLSADPELGYLKLRYKLPGNADSRLIETPITADLAEIAPSESHFAAAVAGFGELLRGNPVLGDWSYDDAATLARASRGDDPFGYRAEFIRLIELAGSAQ